MIRFRITRIAIALICGIIMSVFLSLLGMNRFQLLPFVLATLLIAYAIMLIDDYCNKIDPWEP